MWNKLNLLCPVEDVCEYTIEDGLILNDLTNLVSLLTSSAEKLTQDNNVWSEMRVFQNVQAKYKRILHCDKALLYLQKVGSCLRKMVLLNLSKSYLDLAENFLVNLRMDKDKILLPSRQQLEYILIRTQAASKLIYEALNYSKETFCFLIQRLQIGHLILNLMMATSVTARVNILFKGFLHQVFEIYNKIYPWLMKLRRGTTVWPEPLNLPSNLEAWLTNKESDLYKGITIPQDQLDVLNRFLEKSRSIEIDDSGSGSNVEVSSSTNENQDVAMNNDINLEADDIGEVIERREEPSSSHSSPMSNSLNESQVILRQKIKDAKSLKLLKIIWNNLDLTSRSLLPIPLTQAQIKHVNKMFTGYKVLRNKVRQSHIPISQRKKELSKMMRVARTKLITTLGLSDLNEPRPTEASSTTPSLEPVNTVKGLKHMYQSMYKTLQENQHYEKCEELKKVFKSRRADIKLMFQRGETDTVRNLIYCTSKVFLARYPV